MNDYTHRYGPVALVTGASSGIGRAFAVELAARGLDLVLVARRADRLRDLAAELTAKHGTGVHVLPEDLTDPGAPDRILDAVRDLDVGMVVNNAGFGVKGAFESGDPGALADLQTVNCTVPTRLAHGLVPALRRRGRGALLFTASVEGLIGCPYSAVYSASKAYVIALGEALWGELTPAGIDVLTLCPGATDTEAPAKQGIDPATLHHLMSPEAVVDSALANLGVEPLHVPSDHYRQSMEGLRAMPRRDALTAMARAMAPA
ncbi:MULTISPECIES: SDR family NAD(P)-dependent oxidoreductase [Actinoplanes]|uniref:SDR family NAD(P)-dependent oxidoreductase n=1 Tax=Actinoplanes TaxID=1865 RepID=UPI0005F2F87C|nr:MULTISPECIES: SDR family NAD(P)-dependent oxidoreductase [Actinoplanes]GLY03192.1 short-chain dehydrogenase [Actinoplanes sp. NBRC 101535]